MQKIIQLSEHVVAKIAAGEVIERPSYAVKELVENAIDAHASLVEVHIEDSGLKRITVIDNGEGMSREDVALSFLPHTTSKITNEDHFLGIKTLGFRGEALSSIASISTLTIKSRLHNYPEGTVVKVKHGIVETISPIGMPPGTIVSVDNLFLNVPVRKKFLKSDKTEFRHIIEMMTHFALAYPSIHFVFTHNKKTIFDLSKKFDVSERIKTLLGKSFFEQLIPLKFADGHVEITGYIGKPNIATKYNQKQYIFVNNRSVSDRMISLAVKEAFGTLLPSSYSPAFLLYFRVPAEIVDVNIHPRKEYIAFINPKHIFDVTKNAILQTLNENNLTFRLAAFREEYSAKLTETKSITGQMLKQMILMPEKNIDGNLLKNAPFIQIENTYVLTITKNGILLIDQHAAHERILYEQFFNAFIQEKEKKLIYELPNLYVLDLSLNEKQLIEEHKSIFNELGFSFESFQGNSIIIRTVPKIFKGRNLEKVIKDFLYDLSEKSEIKNIDLPTQRMLTFISCKAAVKSGDKLTNKQMKEIVTTLEKTKDNTTCPHGRPTQITLTTLELNKLFRRR